MIGGDDAAEEHCHDVVQLNTFCVPSHRLFSCRRNSWLDFRCECGVNNDSERKVYPRDVALGN